MKHRVLVAPNALPGFWIFVYRATQMTYFVNAIGSTGVAGVEVMCAAKELVEFAPPTNKKCGVYLQTYLMEAAGRLVNPDATSTCKICPVSATDDNLTKIGIFYADHWRNFGITLVCSAVNIAGALFLFWSFRVPKGVKRAQ